jgi:hypothetical protein
MDCGDFRRNITTDSATRDEKTPQTVVACGAWFWVVVNYAGRIPVVFSISIRFSWVMILQDRMPLIVVECGNFPSRIHA